MSEKCKMAEILTFFFLETVLLLQGGLFFILNNPSPF